MASRRPRYSEQQARAAIAESFSFAETLRRLAMCGTGGNWKTLKKYVAIWQIPVDHFDADGARRRAVRRQALPMSEILVENSSYSRAYLKHRLYNDDLKERRCELCGQDELLRGEPMSLILDHMNGVRDDNRLVLLGRRCHRRVLQVGGVDDMSSTMRPAGERRRFGAFGRGWSERWSVSG